ncbi:ricin-type beta-trefoil lectin domain protein [Streptomyces shenzhenensis]|uniref:ricin-type beta-trefoil lectin domain protein n=1 Tax=Streptomyces shenzhenensis TaxID=943815 RepID=UPI003D90CB39
MPAPDSPSPKAPTEAGAERPFAEAFRQRPARAPHGLVPGRRVWVTLGWAAAVSATVTVSAVVAAGTGRHDADEITTASADRTVPAPTASAPGTPSPSPESPEPSASESKKTESHVKSDQHRVVRPAAPVTVTQQAPASGGGRSSGAAKSSGEKSAAEKGSTEKSTTEKSATVKAPAQDFSRPLGPIVGRYDAFVGRCVQLVGTALQLYPCDGGADQNWQFAANGTLRKDGRCLSLAGRSTGDGTRVVMAACDTTNTTQWRYSPGNDIVNVAADKCLDVANASTAAGTPLQIAWCSGNAAQKWNVP